MTWCRRALAAAGLLAAVGCGGESRVVRVYDGRVVSGAFVPPEAYAAYLRGVLAEEGADLRTALAAYEEAVREDDEDPEPFTRIGDARCRLDPKDRGADGAFSSALRIDPAYAPALAARARCASLRGKAEEGIAYTNAVDAADRRTPSVEALFVRLAAERTAGPADAAARARAIALTAAAGDSPVAWEALILWGRMRSEPDLMARGFEGLLAASPTRLPAIEAGVLELLGSGQRRLAEHVAAAIADAALVGSGGPRDATVARLAVDDALAAGDLARAERRATRGHVPLAEVSARALLAERPEIAKILSERVLAADPSSGCASMVRMAISARRAEITDAPFPKSAPTDRPATACIVRVVERLAAQGLPEIARAWAGRVAALPPVVHDPLTGPSLVELAARGTLAGPSLPLELQIELAARRREAPPALDPAAIDRGIVDARHALVWYALVDPAGTRARALLGRMIRASDRDPLVAFALARIALAAPGSTSSTGWDTVRKALAADPFHPLLVAVALEVAKRGGHADEVPPARARLLAVARTAGERALATE